MFYGRKEDREKEIAKKIRACREMSTLFPIIRDVAEAFDGKVFNCRFEKALQEIRPRMYAQKRYQWLEITAFPNEPGCGEYTLAQIKLSDMPDGKRIPADLIIDAARRKRESLLQQAAQMERDASEAEEKRRQLEYFKSQLEKVRDSICYEVRDIYNLDYRVNFR